MARPHTVAACLIAAGIFAASTLTLRAAEPSLLEKLKADEADAAAEAERYSKQGARDVSQDATHVQVGTIDLGGTDGGCVVNTFCMDPEGRLLVAVGGRQQSVQVVSGERTVETVETGNEIRIFSQEGELVDTWNVPFAPQAMNVAPDLSVYIAGAGQIARLDAEGNVVKQGSTPQIGNLEEFKEQVRQQLVEQAKQRAEVFTQQIERAEEIVAKLNEKPENERTAIDKLRLRNAQRQLDLLESNAELVESQSAEIDIGYYMTYKLKVPGMAVSEQDVFVAVSAVNGYGYDVWRMDHDFGDPVKVVEGLRGCCGQMDIQCQDGDLYVAENSRHRVCRFSREGELIGQWGKSDRTGKEGFEGCCNPMNLRFGANGEVLTAESGCGAIKRYTPEGEFIGLLGHAELQGGCKHVAVAATPDSSKVFMLDVPRTRICILEPRSDAATPAGDGEKPATTVNPTDEKPAATTETSASTPAPAKPEIRRPAKLKVKQRPTVLRQRSAKGSR
ncbi:MAG: hypothetical protein DWQ41_11955 [Planctomycetota bacterium]|nr:MAG: hypothetical protein DWQ41_11955 [Planctomycetota bacterium]